MPRDPLVCWSAGGGSAGGEVGFGLLCGGRLSDAPDPKDGEGLVPRKAQDDGIVLAMRSSGAIANTHRA